jgi:hypothetical protein
MKTRILFLTAIVFFHHSIAQKKADTVVIKVGDSSKVVFAIHDKKDLETLKHYNFQSLMDDMIQKLAKRDSSKLEKPATAYLKDTIPPTEASTMITDNSTVEKNESTDNDSYSSYRSNRRKWHRKKTYSNFSIDLGTNNYLENGKFPDQNNSLYSVRPWGSWYVALNSIQRTRLANKFFLEWGGGFSWYNFKFQNDRVQMSKDDNGVNFALDTRDFSYDKSKLTVAYVQASLVPVIDFGGGGRKPGFFNGRSSSGFRLGAGPYVGYRIDSYTKQKYENNGDTKKEHRHDSYYINNLRYGMRVQIGFKGADFFFNYDMNELFAENKGPKLNAFSFGVSF